MKTYQESIQETLAADFLQQRKKEFTATITPEVAQRTASFVPGGKYTNPQVKAALGLSNIPINPQDVHAHSVKKARSNFEFNSNPVTAFNNANQNFPSVPKGSVYDLLVREGQIAQNGGRRTGKDPAWYDTVDPTNYWRNLYVPSVKEVKNAYDLSRLSEQQMLKFIVINGGLEGIKNIPGMYTSRSSTNPNPEIISRKTGKPVRGTGGAINELRYKFPNFGKLVDQYEETTPKDWNEGGLGPVLGAPFIVAGWFAPDVFKPLPASVKGVIRTADTVFTGAAQAVKSFVEYELTHTRIERTQSGFFDIVTTPRTEEDREDFQNTVIKGNVIYQAANDIFNGQRVDLGEGFFAGGDVKKRAIAAHDAGLPTINGHTWTLGRAVVEPLIQERWIDRDGYAAKVLSGLVDATFTIATDPSIYFDPVQMLMKRYSLTHVGATALLDAAKADKVREGWAAERAAAGQPTTISKPLNMALNEGDNTWVLANEEIVDAADVPRFAGMLPPGTELPEEVQKVVDDLAEKEMSGKSLATMDSPPDTVRHTPAVGTQEEKYNSIGLVRDNEGNLRPDPMQIDNMPYTADGRMTLKKLSSFNNSGELYDAFLGNIPPGAAVEIQDIVDAARLAGKEVDLKEIHKVLVDGVLSANPFYGVQEVPGVIKQATQQTGKQIAHWSLGLGTRQFASMPGSTFFHFADPLSSLKDMNNLMIVMKVPTEARHAMLDRAMRAIATEGSTSRFDLASEWMKTVLAPTLKKSGVPDEWIEQVAKWAGKDSVDTAIHQWTMDALGRGYPTPWLADGTGEVIRSIDFLNHGFLMVSPDHLQQVMRETTNLWKLLKPFRGNPRLEKILNEQISKKLTTLNNKWLKPVAMGAPLPIHMLSKILPDEMMRVLITGQMDGTSLKALGIGGHINYTTHGEVIKSAREITKLFPIVDHIIDLEKQLDDAVKAANAGLANDISDELAKITAKHGTKEQLLGYIQTYQNRMDLDLPGANKKVAQRIEGLTANARQDPRAMRWARENYMQTAFRDKDPIKWADGTAEDITRMNASPEYATIADVLLNGTQDDIRNLGQRFFNGDLRPVLDDYRKGLGNENPLMPLTSVEGLSEWVLTIAVDIATRTGMDEKLLQAIATGKIDGSVIHAGAMAGNDATGDALLKAIASGKVNKITIHTGDIGDEFLASSTLKDYVKNVFINNPAAPDRAPYFPKSGVAEREATDRWMTKGFNVYRDASAARARNPFAASEKWKRIVELIPVMDPTEAQKMWAAIDKTDAPEWFKDSIKRAIPDAKGTATRKQVEILGEMHGQQRVSDVLYDYSKQSYFGARHNLAFGFFNAWFEQWSVWARLIAQNPTIIRKADLIKTGLEGAELPDWWQQDNKGILYEDTNGQQRVAIPGTHQLYSFLGLDAQEGINVRNLSFLGQGIPGFFGAGALAVDSFVPKTTLFEGMRNLFQPYGDPESKFGNIADYFIPSWGQGAIGAVTSAGNRLTNRKIDLFDNIQNIMVGKQSEREKATLVNAILTNLAANSDGTPVTDELRDRLLEDAYNKADMLAIVKSIFHILSPAKTSTEYFMNVKGDSVPAGVIMDDLRRWQTETGDFNQAVTMMLDKYGESSWIYLSGASTAYPGMQATREWQSWNQENSSIVSKYPLVGAWLGPQDGKYEGGVFSSQRSLGWRKPKDPVARIESSLENLAWVLYEQKKESIYRRGLEQGGYSPEEVRTSNTFKTEMKAYAEELKTQFPMWSPKASGGESERTVTNNIRQVMKMVKDKKVLATPAGAAMREYWDYRTKAVTDMLKDNPDMANDTWKSSGRAIYFRQDLIDKGEELVEKYPEFAAVWDNVLSREFDPPELGQ
jgi:hypothetical protein